MNLMTIGFDRSGPADGPDVDGFVDDLNREFDALEDVGLRSPREFLLDWHEDDVLAAARMMIQGKRLLAADLFQRAIDNARDHYVSHHIDDYIDQVARAAWEDQA